VAVAETCVTNSARLGQQELGVLANRVVANLTTALPGRNDGNTRA